MTAPHVRTLPFSLDRAARWYPDAEAFVQGFGDRRYTYAEANERARRVANALSAVGVEAGDRVALLNDSNVEHALAHYGATTLGAVPAGLHGREAPNPLAEMVNRIRASALVFHPRYAEKVAAFRDALDHTEALVALDHLGESPEFAREWSTLLDDAPATEPDVRVGPDDVAFINFSSGTTGRPKALVTRHGQITEMLHLEAGGTTEQARVLNAFSPSFMGWENVTLTNVHTAATTVFFDGDVERVPELAERERLTRISLVTTPWRRIVRSGNLAAHDLGSVESAGVSGEPVPRDLFAAIREHVTENVGTGYGLTETMGSGTSLKPHQIDEETIDSVGKPGPSCDVRIVEPGSGDPAAELPEGETGEILITGPSVCEEVWEDPETTAELFRDGWVVTGDRGYVEDGFLYLQGRADSTIISGGINIYPERVERVLETHPAVAECAVVGTPHEEWREAVKAYVIAAGDVTAEELDAWCRENDDLGDYQRPREYAFVDSLPRTDADKLDRAALEARERED